MCSKGEQKHDDNLEIVLFVAAMDHVGMLSSFRQVWNFNSVGFQIVTINAIFRKVFKNKFSSVSNEHNALYF